jgi:histidinol-phosphate aminotransferase
VTHLVTPDIAAIAPYEPGKPLEELARELGAAWPAEGAIKLASNENPLGPSPLGVEAAARALAAAHRYPDGASYDLRRGLAARLGVPEGQIAVGSGSNELIDLMVQTFCGPDEEVLAPACSFVCFQLSAQAHRRAFREAPNGLRFAYDVDALLAAVRPETKVVFLANPNNPTGAYLARDGLARLVRELPPQILLVLDEAYGEYVRAADWVSGLTLLGARPRLVVLRTFSKIYGLAGLRVGYAVAAPEVVEYVNRVRLPFNVSLIAQAAALAALDDAAHVERSRRNNAVELPALAARLGALGCDVLPSQANFLLVELPAGHTGRAVYERLLGRGVIVRPVSSYGLPGHLRITVGSEADNARLCAALGAVLAP